MASPTSERPKGRVPIENRGSTARDHLANERTFLAWVRTGLGFVGVGVVLEKLVDERGVVAVAMGLTFLVAGTGLLVYGLLRYRKIADLLEGGQYAPAERGPLALVMFCMAVAIGAGLFMLV